MDVPRPGHPLTSMFSSISSTTLASLFFFFNDTATTEIYTLSLHDALPISNFHDANRGKRDATLGVFVRPVNCLGGDRSEEHTSELQSRSDLVCRLLLEKKKNTSHKRAQEQLAPYSVHMSHTLASMNRLSRY